ncbi:CopG family ribbon-helix-helix protein [Rhizobium sp. C4]|uniref:CopG family ribbon-helix-helix protein n=1 Tax=Rhizobium sp. C4 TaxID=1349800 RepID=UPI001E56B04E|nr:ribbon-helix-helix domain-containing protein [Rhizobium sp. C4]MCD2173016.1 ribbon-helix-helix domain-containing protein [Rhizobium sp. C4]
MPKPDLSDPITLRVPVEVLADIEAIAEATERSRSWVIVRALRTYLMNEGGDVLAALKGREQIAEGEHEDIDDVIADVDRIIAGKVA